MRSLPLTLPILALFILVMPYLLMATNDAEVIFDNSNEWPSRLTLNAPVEQENTAISEGKTGILIRLEGVDDKIVAVCDFGRHGIVRLAPEKTDLSARYQDILSGALEKQNPNYISLFAGKLVANKGEAISKLNIPELQSKERMLFLYATDLESGEYFVEEFQGVSAIKNCDASLLVYLQLKGSASDDLIMSLAQASGVDVATFPSFLLGSIARMLGHLETGAIENRLVVTDMNGKILHDLVGRPAIMEFFHHEASQN